MRLFLLLFIFCSCSQTKAQDELNIKDFNFDGIFGTSELDSTSVYRLLGIGYFLAPSSENIDSVISTWIKEHPNATVKSVYTSSPSFTDASESISTYCWVIDGKQNLNLWLVKHGCTHGMNMQYPTNKVKEQLGMTGSDFKDTREEVHISKAEYEQFMELVKIATNEAFENKLGIWNDK